jgi:PEP-CTERM motif-containing protein
MRKQSFTPEQYGIFLASNRGNQSWSFGATKNQNRTWGIWLEGKNMRASLLVVFLAMAASTAALANSITIGQLQFLGTNPQGVSAFKVILDTSGVTASPLTLQNLTLIENRSAQDTGTITSPITILFLGGPGFRLPACPCESLQIDLFFPTADKVITFQLAGGGLFTTNSRPKFFLRPLPGQKFLSAGESASIVLTSVPEPGTLALFAGGLAVMFSLRRRNRCQEDRRQFGTYW